jgi:hypothetical protein
VFIQIPVPIHHGYMLLTLAVHAFGSIYSYFALKVICGITGAQSHSQLYRAFVLYSFHGLAIKEWTKLTLCGTTGELSESCM